MVREEEATFFSFLTSLFTSKGLEEARCDKGGEALVLSIRRGDDNTPLIRIDARFADGVQRREGLQEGNKVGRFQGEGGVTHPNDAIGCDTFFSGKREQVVCAGIREGRGAALPCGLIEA